MDGCRLPRRDRALIGPAAAGRAEQPQAPTDRRTRKRRAVQPCCLFLRRRLLPDCLASPSPLPDCPVKQVRLPQLYPLIVQWMVDGEFADCVSLLSSPVPSLFIDELD